MTRASAPQGTSAAAGPVPPGAARRRGVGTGVLAPVALATGAGLGIGVLTSYAQLWLPEGLASLANSSTSWCVAAGLLALSARSAPVGAVCATVALVGMNAGYGIGSDIRGYTYGLAGLLFYWLAAVVAGPVVGAGVQWVREHRRTGAHRLLAPLSTGALAGVVVGEAVYGLTVIAATTSGGYWTGQLLLGLGGLAAVGATVLRGRSQVIAAVATTVVVAGAFLVVYRLPLIVAFPL